MGITFAVWFNSYDGKYRAECENYNMFSEAEKEYLFNMTNHLSSYYGKGTIMIFFFFACNYSPVYLGNLCFLEQYLTVFKNGLECSAFGRSCHS